MAPRRSQPREPKRISRRETNAKSRRAREARGRAGGKRGGEGEHRGGGAGGDGRGRAPRCALSRETNIGRESDVDCPTVGGGSAPTAIAQRRPTNLLALGDFPRRARSTAPILARASSHARVRNPRLRAPSRGRRSHARVFAAFSSLSHLTPARSSPPDASRHFIVASSASLRKDDNSPR